MGLPYLTLDPYRTRPGCLVPLHTGVPNGPSSFTSEPEVSLSTGGLLEDLTVEQPT